MNLQTSYSLVPSTTKVEPTDSAKSEQSELMLGNQETGLLTLCSMGSAIALSDESSLWVTTNGNRSLAWSWSKEKRQPTLTIWTGSDSSANDLGVHLASCQSCLLTTAMAVRILGKTTISTISSSPSKDESVLPIVYKDSLPIGWTHSISGASAVATPSPRKRDSETSKAFHTRFKDWIENTDRDWGIPI